MTTILTLTDLQNMVECNAKRVLNATQVLELNGNFFVRSMWSCNFETRKWMMKRSDRYTLLIHEYGIFQNLRSQEVLFAQIYRVPFHDGIP